MKTIGLILFYAGLLSGFILVVYTGILTMRGLNFKKTEHKNSNNLEFYKNRISSFSSWFRLIGLILILGFILILVGLARG